MNQIHTDALIIDGLNFHGDGESSVLQDAGITAVNLTVSHFECDLATALDGMAFWHGIISRRPNDWRLIRSATDIEICHEQREIGLIMGWQNLRPIEDKPERLHLLYQSGLRIAQLTYNWRNYLGDGCLEPIDGGLSRLGRDVVALMNDIGMAVDLSHVGQRTTIEAAEASSKPVLATHANARSITPALRNKSDDAIRAIAATGGVIGVSNYGPMCWDGDPKRHPSLDDFERHLDHIVDLVGVDHVGLGTDLPAVTNLDTVAHITQFTLGNYPSAIADYAKAFSNDIRARYLSDCANHKALPNITERLLTHHWSETDVRKFLGGNFLRALREIWGS